VLIGCDISDKNPVGEGGEVGIAEGFEAISAPTPAGSPMEIAMREASCRRDSCHRTEDAREGVRRAEPS